MLLSFSTCLYILTGVFFTSILSGILGMAGGMVLMGVLVWALPVQQSMILHAISQFFANGSRAFIHRKHIYRKSLIPYFLGMGITFAVFVAVAILPSKMTVFLLMGISPFLAFSLPKNIRLDYTKPLHAFLCGVLVTGFQLTAGVSGPLLDIFFQSRSLTRHETVATKAFTQSVSHISKFVYFGFIVSDFGKAAGGLPLWLCALVPFIAMAGSHLSKHILERLTDVHFYRATQAALFAVGTLYLYKAYALWIS